MRTELLRVIEVTTERVVFAVLIKDEAREAFTTNNPCFHEASSSPHLTPDGRREVTYVSSIPSARDKQGRKIVHAAMLAMRTLCAPAFLEFAQSIKESEADEAVASYARYFHRLIVEHGFDTTPSDIERLETALTFTGLAIRAHERSVLTRGEEGQPPNRPTTAQP